MLAQPQSLFLGPSQTIFNLVISTVTVEKELEDKENRSFWKQVVNHDVVNLDKKT